MEALAAHERQKLAMGEWEAFAITHLPIQNRPVPGMLGTGLRWKPFFATRNIQMHFQIPQASSFSQCVFRFSLLPVEKCRLFGALFKARDPLEGRKIPRTSRLDLPGFSLPYRVEPNMVKKNSEVPSS